MAEGEPASAQESQETSRIGANVRQPRPEGYRWRSGAGFRERPKSAYRILTGTLTPKNLNMCARDSPSGRDECGGCAPISHTKGQAVMYGLASGKAATAERRGPPPAIVANVTAFPWMRSGKAAGACGTLRFTTRNLRSPSILRQRRANLLSSPPHRDRTAGRLGRPSGRSPSSACDE